MKMRLIILSLTALCMLGSCASRKNFVYLQDLKEGERYRMVTKYEAVVHRDDRLAITVSCKNPELALPFNRKAGSYQVSADGSITSAETAVTAAGESGYRVDVDGNIDFPILGKLYVEGLKVSQVTNLIKNKIMEKDYIKDPTVSLEFLNFKYTVLGAVSHNGTFSVDGDRVTLIEAIAKAGDLTGKARPDRVSVLREQGGEWQMYMHDLRSKDIINSPCFYLQQNDIVYVEPKYRKKDTEDRSIQYGTLMLSVITAVCSFFWAIK